MPIVGDFSARGRVDWKASACLNSGVQSTGFRGRRMELAPGPTPSDRNMESVTVARSRRWPGRGFLVDFMGYFAPKSSRARRRRVSNTPDSRFGVQERYRRYPPYPNCLPAFTG